jgi:hypothetical protein
VTRQQPGGQPADPLHAVRDWLASLERRHVRCVTVAKISRDLWPLLTPPHPSGPGQQPPGHAAPPQTAQPAPSP